MQNQRIPRFVEMELTAGVTKRLDKASAMLNDLRMAGPRGITDEAMIRNYTCLIKDLIDEAHRLHNELWHRVHPRLIREQVEKST